MAKTKKNRKNTVDLIKKVSKKQTSQNPFEVHVNKSKFNVLGQKSKNDVGLPGVSRSKAIQKRKVTLLQEYKIQDKANKFLDRRIGEHNKNMTKEDKVMARFTAEKMRAHNKQSSLFNLDDDVVLTHQGRTLEEIEQFEDPRSDDEDDQDGRNMKGTLDSEFVKEAHFGGGTLSVAAQDGELSRQDLISQLIADSKKRKAEKQQLKESTVKLTEQLDSEWKDLLPLLHPTRPTETGPTSTTKTGPSTTPAVQPPKPPVDKNSFDFLVKELRFEATGKPSDKLKSEDEIIRQEKQKLEQLERERLKRMNLHEEDNQRPRTAGRAYKSADDLDDGFALENVGEDDGDESETSDKEEDKLDENSDEDTDAEDSDGEENEDDDDKENEEDDDKTEEETIKNAGNNEKGVKRKYDCSEEKNEESDDEGEEDYEDDEDSFDDLVDNEDSDEDSEEEENDNEVNELSNKKPEDNIHKKKKLNDEGCNEKQKASSKDVESKAEESFKSRSNSPTKKSLRFSTDNDAQTKELKTEDNNKSVQKGILKNIKNANEDVEMKNIESKESEILENLKQTSDLPFTFEVPKEYEDLCELLDGRALCDMRTILERMIKVNHWSLGGDNKAKLNQVFAFLLQYLDDSVDARQPKKCWQVLNTLSPVLFDLCLMDPDSSGGYLRGVIQEKYQKFSRRDSRYPSVHSLVFLKLVSTLFPTSDARHYVTTPALIFLCHALGRGNAVSTRDVAVGVFLATLSVEYIDLSKRYLSELINFLQGILLLFCHSLPLPLTKPFKTSSKQLLAFSQSDLLSVETNPSESIETKFQCVKTNKSKSSKTNSSESIKTNKSQSDESNSTIAKDLSQLTISACDLSSSMREISTVFKVKILRAVLNLVTVLIDKYSSYDAAYLIFDNVASVCRQLRKELNDPKSGMDSEGKTGIKELVMGKIDNVKELTEVELPVKVGKGNKKQKSKMTQEDKGTPKNTPEEILINTNSDRPPNPSNGVILKSLQDQLESVLEKFNSLKKEHPFRYVAKEKEKPKILRLFEPEIKPVLKFHTKGAQKEREKLLSKYKKEMKGAIREIRKDGRFLQKVKLKQQSRADQERQRKVKEILGGCANQEGEIRNLKRKKK